MNKKEVKNKSSPKRYAILLEEYQMSMLLDFMDYCKDNDKKIFDFLYELEIVEDPIFIPRKNFNV